MIKNEIRVIPLNSIVGTVEPVRRYYNEKRITDLKESLKESGVIQPILVMRTSGNSYRLIIGSRRVMAAQKNHLKNIPAIILDKIGNKEALVLALAENLQRQDLTPFEEAWGILRLAKDHQMNNSEIAKELGKNQSFVRQRLKLLSLPSEIQQMVNKERLSISHVEIIATLDSPAEQKEIAIKAAKERLSPGDLGLLVRRAQNQSRSTRVTNSTKIALRVLSLKEFLKSVLLKAKEMKYHEKEEIKGSLRELKNEIEYFLKET